jgi:hypothetical protein
MRAKSEVRHERATTIAGEIDFHRRVEVVSDKNIDLWRTADEQAPSREQSKEPK